MKDLYITCGNTGFLNQHQIFLNSKEEMIVVYITDIHITCIAAGIHKKARILVTTQHRRVHLIECLTGNCLEYSYIVNQIVKSSSKKYSASCQTNLHTESQQPFPQPLRT